MKSKEAVDWQVPSEWKRRLWIGSEKMFRAFDVTKIENLFGEKDQLKKENKKDKSLFNLHVMRLLYLTLPHTLSLSFLVGHISQIHHRESLPKIHYECIFHIESARVIPYYKIQELAW